MDITNKTGKPLSVPLPGGKRLFLGHGKTGQVTPKALARPALAKLVEAGDVEVSDGGGNSIGGGAEAKGGVSRAQRQGGTGAMRQSGDR